MWWGLKTGNEIHGEGETLARSKIHVNFSRVACEGNPDVTQLLENEQAFP